MVGVLGGLVRPIIYFWYLLANALEIFILSLGLPRAMESCEGVAWTPPLALRFHPKSVAWTHNSPLVLTLSPFA